MATFGRIHISIGASCETCAGISQCEAGKCNIIVPSSAVARVPETRKAPWTIHPRGRGWKMSGRARAVEKRCGSVARDPNMTCHFANARHRLKVQISWQVQHFANQNLHVEVHKVLCLLRNLHFEIHKVLCLPGNLHPEVAKCCTCHEICTLRRCLPRPATKSALQVFTNCCACPEICTLRLTKYCACYEICTARFTKRCTCHEICTPVAGLTLTSPLNA